MSDDATSGTRDDRWEFPPGQVHAPSGDYEIDNDFISTIGKTFHADTFVRESNANELDLFFFHRNNPVTRIDTGLVAGMLFQEFEDTVRQAIAGDAPTEDEVATDATTIERFALPFVWLMARQGDNAIGEITHKLLSARPIHSLQEAVMTEALTQVGHLDLSDDAREMIAHALCESPVEDVRKTGAQMVETREMVAALLLNAVNYTDTLTARYLELSSREQLLADGEDYDQILHAATVADAYIESVATSTTDNMELGLLALRIAPDNLKREICDATKSLVVLMQGLHEAEDTAIVALQNMIALGNNDALAGLEIEELLSSQIEQFVDEGKYGLLRFWTPFCLAQTTLKTIVDKCDEPSVLKAAVDWYYRLNTSYATASSDPTEQNDLSPLRVEQNVFELAVLNKLKAEVAPVAMGGDTEDAQAACAKIALNTGSYAIYDRAVSNLVSPTPEIVARIYKLGLDDKFISDNEERFLINSRRDFYATIAQYTPFPTRQIELAEGGRSDVIDALFLNENLCDQVITSLAFQRPGYSRNARTRRRAISALEMRLETFEQADAFAAQTVMDGVRNIGRALTN